MDFTIGQRVRTLIHLDSADWDPEQPDIPAGALGTVKSIHTDAYRGVAGTGKIMSYGVLLDASVHKLAASLDPDQIEAAE